VDNILVVIGANIRHYRGEAGLTQEQLAELAGLHRTYIGHVERAEKNVSARNIAKIARALQIEPYELLKPRNEDV
jgi:transcriptional regulator with XRE-family HTH domain